LLAAVAFFGLSLYLVPGLLGAPLGRLDAYLPPRQADDPALLTTSARATAAGGAGRAEAFAWHTDAPAAAFRQARRSGQPVFIDFTGYTCTNCRDMEANVFPRPEVARRLQEHFVLLRLFTDDPETGTRFQRYQLGLTGTTALPTYAIVDPAGEEGDEGTLVSQVSGMTPAGAFAAFLEEGNAAFSQRQAGGAEPLATR
jgi:thiol:disulfide interchange protein DsbD